MHGAAGGVGLAAVDVGKLLGATVIATASTEEKLAACRQMGADHVDQLHPGLPRAVKALTGDRGADVIYDPVGGDVSDESMRCIAPFGRLLIVGFTSGRPAQLKANHLLIKDAEAIGFTIGALSRLDPARERKNLRHPHGLAGRGAHHPARVAPAAPGAGRGGAPARPRAQGHRQGGPGVTWHPGFVGYRAFRSRPSRASPN